MGIRIDFRQCEKLGMRTSVTRRETIQEVKPILVRMEWSTPPSSVYTGFLQVRALLRSAARQAPLCVIRLATMAVEPGLCALRSRPRASSVGDRLETVMARGHAFTLLSNRPPSTGDENDVVAARGLSGRSPAECGRVGAHAVVCEPAADS